MIAVVSTRRHRILDHVREYLARYEAQRVRTPARRRHAEQTPPELRPVERYISVLEQVLDGHEAHRRHLRDARWGYTRAIKGLRNQARPRARGGDYSLADYAGAARVYVHALETQLQTSNVPSEVLEEMRRFYALAAAEVSTRTGEDRDVDAPSPQE